MFAQAHSRAPAAVARGASSAGAAAAKAAAAARRPWQRRQQRRVSNDRLLHVQAQAAQTAAPDINEIYTRQQPTRLKGAGFALEAAKTLAAGDLLFVSAPLALVSRPNAADAADSDAADGQQQLGPRDDDLDSLAEQLAVNGSARAQGWLQLLDNGNADQQQSRTKQLPDLQALAAVTAAAGSSGSDTAPTTASAGSQPLDEDMLLDITELNARLLVEDEGLLSLSAAADAPASAPSTLVGVWPELALLQHSCCPNASVVAHQSAAVVHACRGIPKQGLVLFNQLGPQLLAPLAERRAALQQAAGVRCMCARCRDEEKQDINLLQLVADIYEACLEQVAPELEAAVEADDDATLEVLKDQLAAYCEVVDAGFSKLAVRQQSQIWLQASLFKLYELTAIAAAACGEVDARLLELLAALAGDVSPGSPEHLFWSRQYRDEVAADEEAQYDGALREAEAALQAAYRLRYGAALSRELYKRLDGSCLD